MGSRAVTTRTLRGTITAKTATLDRNGRVAMRLVFPILDAAEREGASRARVLGDITLPATVRDPAEVTASLSLSDYFVLLERAEDALLDPGFVLRAASGVDPRSFGAVGFACMTSPTLGEAFHRAARYHVVCTDAACWWRADAASPRRKALSFPRAPSRRPSVSPQSAIVFEQRGPERRGRDAAVEFALAEMLCHARFLAGEWIEPIETRFAHACPSRSDPFDRFFGGRVRWSEARNEMIVPTELLDRPIAKADPHLLAYFDSQSESLLSRVGEPGRAADVLDAIIRALPSGTPSIASASAALGMSARTLRRRLAEGGDSFQGLLDKARQTMAARYLERGDLAVGEIAFLLGFSEPSPFYRAFRRWFGVSPEQYRGPGKGSAQMATASSARR
jgi:AraC-like DNA-binding protein